MVLALMGVGYSAFSSLLTINGTANVQTNWCVGFDNTKTSAFQITKGAGSGSNPNGTMTYSGTACSTNLQPNSSLTANFYQPGDQIEYTLTIKNASSLTAAIKSINVDGTDVTSNTTKKKENITYIINMPEDTTLAPNASTTMTVIAKFQNDTPIGNGYTGESQSITVRINAEQDDGNGGFTPTPAEQKVYAINTDDIYKNTSTLQDIGQTYNSFSATGKNTCIRYTIENDTVTGAEVCFTKGAAESCLQGWIDECQYDESTDACTFTGTQTVFNSNKLVLQSAFTEENACNDGGFSYSCIASGWSAVANDGGYVYANDGSWKCYVYSDGSAYCKDSGGGIV